MNQPRSPQRQLWCAVLDRAVEDFCQRRPTDDGTAREIIKDEAAKFLLDPDGAWAQSRRLICFCAGIDPDAFEERVRAISTQGSIR